MAHRRSSTHRDLVYVRNDPVNNVDPDGKRWVRQIDIGYSRYWEQEYIQGDWYYWEDEGDGGGGSPIEIGSSVTEKDARTAFLNSVLGEHAKNISDRIGDENSDCWKRLQELINKVGTSSLTSPKDLIDHLNRAAYDVMGDDNGTYKDGSYTFGQFGTTTAEVSTTGFMGTGTLDKVTLGWKFFNSNNRSPSTVLIHEAFHLFSGSDFIWGIVTTGLTDAELYRRTGVSGAKEFNDKIDEKCK